MSTPIGPSGWHPDPYGRFEYRYHNGAQWTADVAMGGRRFVDPNGSPGSPLAPGAYPMQAPNVPPVAPRTRGFAVASFIIGLVSVLAAWLPFVFAAAAVGAALALVFGILGARKASAQDGHGRGFAIAGIALSVAAALLCIVGFMFTRVVLRELDQYANPGSYELGPSRCDTTNDVVTMTGTIRNTDTVTRDFTLDLSILASGLEVGTETVAVDRLAPGETATFRSNGLVVVSDGAVVSCRVVHVNGPMPFDMPPDDIGNLDG